MRYHVAVHSNILSDLKSVRVGESFAVKFPGDLRCWVATGDTFQEHARSGLESLFGECLTDLRGLDCGCKKV